MAKFFNRDMEDLANQLTHSPRRLRVKQIRGVETLLELVDPNRSYPFDFVCYHITEYRKRNAEPGASIPGAALVRDLVTLAEFVSRRGNIPASDLGEPFKTHAQVAEMLGVSTKTIRRWRDRGLMGIRVVYEDGVNRLAFLSRTVDRFMRQNGELVARGASFRQLTDGERDHIVGRARELIAQRPLKLHAAARLIAEETGRAVETVRYTLRRFDQSDPSGGLFSDAALDACGERFRAMWRCHKADEVSTSIASAFDCTVKDVQHALRYVEVHEWRQAKWDCVHAELFDAPGADAIILDACEPPVPEVATPKVPRDLPPYLRSLYLTPLLNREQEQDLFRRYNYVKFKLCKALAAVELDELTHEQHAAIGALVEQAETFRQRIVQANLRLVVSIAKKHVGRAPCFFETISDGNVSLMRAVERFDYTRGIKFSTYATWAVMKNYARSIPESLYHGSRYVTGQDELLGCAADYREAPASGVDRRKIRELISDGLQELSEREREIVSHHFGLGSLHGSVTLEQLGQRFGVTKERIRQIERRALLRLRELLPSSLGDAFAC